MAMVGVISELRRFPVKSMLGERVDRLDLTAVGAAGDRVCALIDHATGKVASAKLPHRWRTLLQLRSRLLDGLDAQGRPLVEIELPDGTRLRSDEPALDGHMSALLGRDVTLAFSRPAGLEIERAKPDQVAKQGEDRQVSHDTLTLGAAAPAGGFVDYAPVHVIAGASLDRVGEIFGDTPAEAARFRPNIVINSVDVTPFQENGWVGGTLRIGEAIVLRVITATPRCAVPALAHGELPLESRMTRVIGTLNRVDALGLGPVACLGAYAQVIQGGLAAVGSQVRFDPDASQ